MPIFNNREYAIAIWLFVAALWLLPKQGVRKSVIGLARIIFGTKIFFFLLGLIAYVALLVLLLGKLHLWETQMLKETIYWFFGTAIVLFINITDAGKDEHFFRKKAVGTLGFAVALEFIIGLYAFSLPVELVLIPLLVLVACMIVVAEMDPKYAQVKKLLEFIMSALGILLLMYTLIMIIRNAADFFTLATLRDFLLHPFLTIALLPFIYLLALYYTYESFFLRIKFAARENPEVATFLKRKVFAICRMNLKKLNDVSKAITRHMWTLSNKEEAATMIDRYQKGELRDEIS